LNHSFGRDRGFLQALVLVSEQESRLVTVITFWQADGFAEARERRAVWMRQKLAPYVDRSMRVQPYCARVMQSGADSKREDLGEGADIYSSPTVAAAACVS